MRFAEGRGRGRSGGGGWCGWGTGASVCGTSGACVRPASALASCAPGGDSWLPAGGAQGPDGQGSGGGDCVPLTLGLWGAAQPPRGRESFSLGRSCPSRDFVISAHLCLRAHGGVGVLPPDFVIGRRVGAAARCCIFRPSGGSCQPPSSVKSHVCPLGPPLCLSGPHPVRPREAQWPPPPSLAALSQLFCPFFLPRGDTPASSLTHWWAGIGWHRRRRLGGRRVGHRHVTGGASPPWPALSSQPCSLLARMPPPPGS